MSAVPAFAVQAQRLAARHATAAASEIFMRDSIAVARACRYFFKLMFWRASISEGSSVSVVWVEGALIPS